MRIDFWICPSCSREIKDYYYCPYELKIVFMSESKWIEKKTYICSACGCQQSFSIKRKNNKITLLQDGEIHLSDCKYVVENS